MDLIEKLKKYQLDFHPVVPFNPQKEKIISLDLTQNNVELTEDIFLDTDKFSDYISNKLKRSRAKFGIGGYKENRDLYKRSKLFNITPEKAYSTGQGQTGAQPGDEMERVQEVGRDNAGALRTLHLGTDIWGPEGTEIYAPMGGMVHSFAFNKNYGDYGATLILLHQLDTLTFYTLYGHLSLNDISKVSEFEYIIRGHVIGHFGCPADNGHWPPHLHFQVIKDLRLNKGDYPGVCMWGDRKEYLSNCPDPEYILNLRQFL